MQRDEEISLDGYAVVRGVAIGIPFILTYHEEAIPEVVFPKGKVEEEVKRYTDALNESRKDLLRLKEELAREGVNDGVAVLEAHLQIIDDPLLNSQIVDEIRTSKKNAEFIFQEAIQRYRKKFEAIDDPFFQSRFEDVHDISKRVLAYLKKMKRIKLSELPHNSIVLTHVLSPSDAAEANRHNIAAFVTQFGGATSHTAIVANAKGIPYVANVNLSKLPKTDKVQMAIVDGLNGKVIVNPSEKTLTHYRTLKAQLHRQQDSLKNAVHLPTQTQDGHTVHLSANVEIADDFALLKEYGAEGVGLFRSEYIVLRMGSFPSEDEQYRIYKSLVEEMKGHPVVIRAFDIGFDKVSCNIRGEIEPNPALGCRAIRFLLNEKELFKSQMRAILRVSTLGDVRILFPMISSLNELLEAKEVVKEAYKELKKSKHPVHPKVKLGCMIEVPSAAMIADLIAKECDFLSIGTNDLIQYALAVDRTSQSASALYASTHPGVVRLLQVIIREAKKKNVPVCICGEIASDPRFIPLLLGLGISEFSVSCRFLPLIKQVIRNTDRKDAVRLTKRILSLKTANEIQDALIQEYDRTLPAGVITQF